MMDQTYIGVDVAKAWLDIDHPARGAKRIENTPAAVRSFARTAARGRLGDLRGQRRL